MADPIPIDIYQWNQVDRGARIEKFVATAVKMTGADSFNPDNLSQRLIHWRGAGAYRLSEDFQSTSFDTRKFIQGQPAVQVQLISKPFDVSFNAAGFWETPLLREYTTIDVYNLLVAKKLNQYLYNGNGSGCLTWTTRLIEVLEAEGVLPAGSKASFLKVVDLVRANPEYWVPDESGAEFYE